MAESGCLQDIAVQNIQIMGRASIPGALTSKVNIEHLTAARTVNVAESGTVFTLNSAGGAYVVTLPTVADGDGCVFKFICAENTPTNDITISSNAANIVGVLHVQADTAESNLVAVTVTGVTNVLFDTTCLIGDHIELICNGTNYFVKGQGSVQTAFTVT
jgi:hypothetical protein